MPGILEYFSATIRAQNRKLHHQHTVEHRMCFNIAHEILTLVFPARLSHGRRIIVVAVGSSAITVVHGGSILAKCLLPTIENAKTPESKITVLVRCTNVYAHTHSGWQQEDN